MLQPLQDPSKRFFDQVVVESSYIIFQEGDKIYAKNGMTGQIEFSGSDASEVIQNAINALPPEGGKIFVKSGNYYLSRTVYLRDNLIIKGEGIKSTVFHKTKDTSGFAGKNIENLVMENFGMDGHGYSGIAGNADYGYGAFITFGGDGTKPCYFIFLKNIKTYNGVGAHIHFFGTDNSLENVYRNVVLENIECHLNPGTRATNPMLLLDYVNGAWLYNCYVHEVAGKSEGCIALDGKNIWAYNCVGIGGYEGLRVERGPRAAENINIIGGLFAENGTGILLYPRSKHVRIHGVRCYRNGGPGIGLYESGGHEDIIIENCDIEESGYPTYSNKVGISIANTDTASSIKRLIIRNNRIKNIGFAAGENRGISIRAYNADQIIIEDNVIVDDRDTKYLGWGIEFRSIPITGVVVCRRNKIYGVTSPIIWTYGCTTPNAIIKDNIGYPTENFKSSGVSVPIGTGNVYGSATVVKSLSGVITYPRIKITWGGTFGTGETVTVKVEAVYNDGSTAFIEKSATTTGSLWLTDDDIMVLIAEKKYIVNLNIYAKTNLSSTTVTVTINAYGKA